MNRPPISLRGLAGVVLAAAILTAGPPGASAQTDVAPVTSGVPLDSLVAHALDASPVILAAEHRVEAARAAVGPAGALPDPMLTAGVMNVPLGEREEGDMMARAMPTVGVGQTVPFPGKLPLRRLAAELELAAAEARLDAVRWEVRGEVVAAYAELAFLDGALEIVERNRALLGDFVRVTEARYGVGTGAQADVIKAGVELARLAEEAAALTERRRAALARLNAALDRPTDVPVDAPAIPVRVARAAVPDDAREIRFTSAALGARAADSPLPPLEEAQREALRSSPVLRAHEAEIAAQAARVELARRAHLPDFDLSVQYGLRGEGPDLVSAMVSVPIPVNREGRQALEAREAEARLAALRAEHHQHAAELRARVAEAYADLERERTRLALFVRTILPQGRAALESATVGFQVGRVDFLTLLESQATLYDYETQYHRALADFAARLAELEGTIGEEILR